MLVSSIDELIDLERDARPRRGRDEHAAAVSSGGGAGSVDMSVHAVASTTRSP